MQVIIDTKTFVLEHTSCREHDDIKQRIDDIVRQYEELKESGEVMIEIGNSL